MSNVRIFVFTFGVIAAACLTGCASGSGVGHSDLSEAQRNQVDRQLPRPEIERSANFETVVVETDIAVPLESFEAWFASEGASVFASLPVTPQAAVSVEQTEVLSRVWRQRGDRRRVVFGRDSALEEITANELGHLQYEVWKLSTYFGRYFTYAVSDLTFSESAQGTHVRWSYAFRPLAGPDGWLIRPHVNGEFRRSMEVVLANLRARACATLPSTHNTTSA